MFFKGYTGKSQTQISDHIIMIIVFIGILLYRMVGGTGVEPMTSTV